VPELAETSNARVVVGLQDSHGHGKRSFFGIVTSEGHPGDVERVREGPERLCPDDAKVLCSAAAVELGEATVEDVAEKMAA
jgi:hypothetical protein